MHTYNKGALAPKYKEPNSLVEVVWKFYIITLIQTNTNNQLQLKIWKTSGKNYQRRTF